jgi:septation ring formation regulator EzrA
MTASELQQLVEFMAPRFDAIGARFDAIDTRFDRIETRLTRVEVVQEQQGDRIQQLAEGLTSFREEVDRRFGELIAEMNRRFEGQEALMRALFRHQEGRTDELDTRVTRLERGR